MKISGWQICYDAIIYDDEDWYGNSHHYEYGILYSDTVYQDENVANEELEKVKKKGIYIGCGLTESHVTNIYLKKTEIDIV